MKNLQKNQKLYANRQKAASLIVVLLLKIKNKIRFYKNWNQKYKLMQNFQNQVNSWIKNEEKLLLCWSSWCNLFFIVKKYTNDLLLS